MREVFATDVVVIGGGMTGVGILRDLALRGIKTILIEQKDLGHGTSSRNHGLLHSGARYAVRDADAAVESYRENIILKKTISGSIEDTGGLYVKVPGDSEDYLRRWVSSCQQLGIPIEEISLATAFQEEPYLTKEAEAVYRVPDGAVDPFTMLVDVAADAIEHGANVLTYHQVKEIIVTNSEVSHVIVSDHYTGVEKEIHANVVINAAGPWGAKIAELAKIPIKITNNKGMLTVLNHRINRQVINRLRMPGDADIFVPAHNVTIFGTTGKNVEDPNDTSLQRKEFEEMIAEGMALVPNLANIRMIRGFSGSRPLFQETATNDASGRNVTRGMALLDHEKREGLKGFITITGGKLTTFRYMAEKTADLICEKLGVNTSCSTHEIAVPKREAKEFFKKSNIAPAAKNKLISWAGVRAQEMEATLETDKRVVCECEQVTWSEIEASLTKNGRFHLGDIRRRTRLGMGPCQGTYCHHRAVAIAVEKGLATREEAELALKDGVENRMKGMGVVATGETSKQLHLMDAINCTLISSMTGIGGKTHV